MDVAVGSEQGARRERNTDAYLSDMLGPNAVFFGVADGFGTVMSGTSAAVTALETIRDYLRGRRRLGAEGRVASEASIRTLLLSALDHTNARLYAFGGSHEDFVGSGSSLTVVLVVDRHAFVGHVGDARAYLLRFGRLEPLTTDDAVFSDVVASVKTSLPAKPRSRALLWRSLGTQAKLEASIAHIALSAGDQLVLCTDGIHRCVSSDEMCDVLLEAKTSSEVITRLFGMVKARGSADNGTLIVARDLLASQPLPAVRISRPLGRRLSLLLLTVLTVVMFLALFVVHI